MTDAEHLWSRIMEVTDCSLLGGETRFLTVAGDIKNLHTKLESVPNHIFVCSSIYSCSLWICSPSPSIILCGQCAGGSGGGVPAVLGLEET